MSNLLMVLWVAGLIATVVALFRPIQRAPFLRTRKRALIFGAAVFLGVPVLASLVDPEFTKPTGQTQAKNTVAASPSPAAPASPTEPLKISAEEKREQVEAFLRTVNQGEKACSSSFDNVVTYVERNDRQSAYEAAKEAEDLCSRAATYIGGVAPPAFATKDQRKKFREGLETLSSAYSMKSYTARGFAAVLDGNERPSMIADVKERGQLAQVQVLQGSVKLMSAASDAGVDITKLKIGEEKE